MVPQNGQARRKRHSRERGRESCRPAIGQWTGGRRATSDEFVARTGPEREYDDFMAAFKGVDLSSSTSASTASAFLPTCSLNAPSSVFTPPCQASTPLLVSRMAPSSGVASRPPQRNLPLMTLSRTAQTPTTPRKCTATGGRIPLQYMYLGTPISRASTKASVRMPFSPRLDSCQLPQMVLPLFTLLVALSSMTISRYRCHLRFLLLLLIFSLGPTPRSRLPSSRTSRR